MSCCSLPVARGRLDKFIKNTGALLLLVMCLRGTTGPLQTRGRLARTEQMNGTRCCRNVASDLKAIVGGAGEIIEMVGE